MLEKSEEDCKYYTNYLINAKSGKLSTEEILISTICIKKLSICNKKLI